MEYYGILRLVISPPPPVRSPKDLGSENPKIRPLDPPKGPLWAHFVGILAPSGVKKTAKMAKNSPNLPESRKIHFFRDFSTFSRISGKFTQFVKNSNFPRFLKFLPTSGKFTEIARIR